MRPIVKGDWPVDAAGVVVNFSDHKEARKFLEGRTGRYCHFCEMRITNPLAIEHIKNQALVPRLINNWNNFLLICDYCNSRKPKKKSPVISQSYWPHKHNTYLAFECRIDGIIYVHSSLTPQNRIDKAQKTVELYGLDKIKDSGGGSDQRYLDRLTAIDKAAKRLKEYTSVPPLTTIDNIVDMAGSTGFWSVWYKMFETQPAVLIALLNSTEYRGIEQSCFPAPTYSPIHRNHPLEI